METPKPPQPPHPPRPVAPPNQGATQQMAPPPSAPVSPGATVPDLGATVVPGQAPSTSHDATQVLKETLVPSKPAPAPTAKPSSMEQQIGDFKVIKKLGQGGMGEVFLAHQVSLDRQVALKVMAKQYSSQETFVKRFIREAQTMAKLDHPHIVRGYAVGEHEGCLFLAMELIKGKSMQDWMERLGKLSIPDALHITIRVADALQHAHDISLIHRDIKPDNILITDKGVVKVSDLGLAKDTDEDNSMTQSGTGLGTPYYMPPEQARNAKYVDARSDIYALGGTLYHFLTGKLPYSGDSAVQLIMAKEKGTFTRARSVNNEIPERLDLMIDKMLAKDPKHRYQTCAELMKDLMSLNLDAPYLSFVDGAAEAAKSGSPFRTPSVGSMQQSVPQSAAPRAPAPARPASVSRTASLAAPTHPTAAMESVDGMWYVIVPGPDKTPVKAKMSIARLRQLLQAGKIDLATKASRTPKGEYQPLLNFPEFAQQKREKLVKNDIAKDRTDFKKIYKQYDRQQRWAPLVKRLKGLVSGLTGAVGLIIYLAIIAAVIIGAIFVVTNWNYLVRKTGLTNIPMFPDQNQSAPAEAPAAPPVQQ